MEPGIFAYEDADISTSCTDDLKKDGLRRLSRQTEGPVGPP